MDGYLASSFIVEDNINYNAYNSSSYYENYCYDYYYNNSITPTVLAGLMGAYFGMHYGKQWGGIGSGIGMLGGMMIAATTNFLFYFATFSCMDPVINTPFPSTNSFSHLVDLSYSYCYCYLYSNHANYSYDCNFCESVEGNSQYYSYIYFDYYSNQCTPNFFGNIYTNENVRSATLYASTIIMGLYGSIIGSTVGANYRGERVGAKQAQNLITNNGEWIEEPYLDVAFRTTQGADVIYDATARLRPNNPGWINGKMDSSKTFLSSVKVGWLINKAAEDGLSENSQNDDLYNVALPNQTAETIAEDFKTHDFLVLSGTQVHIPHTQLGTCEVFRGVLPCVLSIRDLIEAVCKMKPENGDFPACSWSGQSKVKKGIIQDVMNPAMFTCRLLENLGVSLHDTELSRVLTPYTADIPVTREVVIRDLHKHRESLQFQPNEENIRRILANRRDVINPLIRNIIGSNEGDPFDIEKGLLEKERQVKTEIAQSLLREGVPLHYI